MKTEFLEVDLYVPLRQFFVNQGFTVASEVKGCDLAAQKGEELVIVEMKRAFTLKLVYQAMERQKLTPFVYVAIPRPGTSQRIRAWKDMLALLTRLSVGLLTVAMDSETRLVEEVLPPGNCMVRKNGKKVRALLCELSGRSGDYNTGGMSRRKIATAFREKSIALACTLEQEGALSLAAFRARGFDPKTLGILSRNFDHWFVREKKGVYGLSEKGREALLGEEFASLIAFYREKARAFAEDRENAAFILETPKKDTE